jgi:Cof subfamily protein (haloacid dehalogenase superfamily)
MNLKNIKLVVSDMDGTLLNSKGKVSDRFFQIFKQLQKQNITFCAASGRQHNSIVEKLHSIKDNIFVVAENGGIATKGKKIFLEKALAAKKIKEVIPIVRTIKDANLVLCGKNGAYIESNDEKFTTLFQEYYNKYFKVDDLTNALEKTTFFKMAIYHPISSEKFLYPKLKHLEKDFLLKISSPNWLDISSKGTNKGNALQIVQEQLNISKEETLVFGDYHNDIEMMQQSGVSVAMQNGHQDIKDLATITTESNDNYGVELVLEKLLEDKLYL